VGQNERAPLCVTLTYVRFGELRELKQDNQHYHFTDRNCTELSIKMSAMRARL
jgi:hypothetical protein